MIRWGHGKRVIYCDNSNIFISAKETAVDLRIHDRLLGQDYLPFWMRRALMGCDGAMVLAAQNGEPDGRSGNRV